MGIIHLALPALGAKSLTGSGFGRRTRLTVRALGVRQIAQAVLTGPHPAPAVARLGVAVDAAHAASMVGLALVDRELRNVALVSAAIATGFAVAGTRSSGRVHPV